MEQQHFSSPTASADAKLPEYPTPSVDDSDAAKQLAQYSSSPTASAADAKPAEEPLSPVASPDAKGAEHLPADSAGSKSEHRSASTDFDANKELLEWIHSTPVITKHTWSQFLAKLQLCEKPSDDSDSALLALLVTSNVLSETTDSIEAMYEVHTQVLDPVTEVEQVITGTLYSTSFFDLTTNCVTYIRFVVWRSVGNANSIHVEVFSLVGVKDAIEKKTIYMKGTAAPGAATSSCNNSSTSDGCSGSQSLGILSPPSPAKKRARVGGGESGTKSITLSALLTGRILCTGVLDLEYPSEPVVVIAANVVDYYIGAGDTRSSAPPQPRPNEVPLLFKEVVDELTCIPQDVMDVELLLLTAIERIFENPVEFPSYSVLVAGYSRTYVAFHMIRSIQKT